MQTVADIRGVGVKNREKIADVLCGRPLTLQYVIIFICQQLIDRAVLAMEYYPAG